MKDYKQLDGWFDWEPIYSTAAESLPSGAVIAEIGVWMGKSVIYLAQQFKLRNKKVKIWAVDTFRGAETCSYHMEIVAQNNGSILSAFWKNVKDFGLDDYIVPICSKSDDCLDKIPEKEFDFVFLDSDHAYDVVSKELALFYPRLKLGGIIGGHDANQPDVGRAVADFFADKPQQKIMVSNISWVTQKV